MAIIHLVAAARPNFMKIAPLWHALTRAEGLEPVLVHTGQHYDEQMFASVFRDLGLPDPDISLHVGSGTHAEQTGGVMIAYEKVLLEKRPDLVVVVGDVNATPGAAFAAVKLGIPTAHLEAGLRSNDRTMPEEINRVATDAIADYLWTPSADGDEHLLHEGIPPARIARVGNIMIDTLVMLRPKIDACDIRAALGIGNEPYGVVTLHRPSNVDRGETLAPLCEALRRLARETKLVFPAHPRTKAKLESFNLLGTLTEDGRVIVAGALSYIPFMALVGGARFVVTDSGGVQEETTFLGIPCVTLRANTERPVTVTEGTNILAAPATLEAALAQALSRPKRTPPALWDGDTASRVVAEIRRITAR